MTMAGEYPPGLGLRQPSGALETTAIWAAARVHYRALPLPRPKAVEDNRSPRLLPRVTEVREVRKLSGASTISEFAPLRRFA